MSSSVNMSKSEMMSVYAPLIVEMLTIICGVKFVLVHTGKSWFMP